MNKQGNLKKKRQWGKVEIFALIFSLIVTTVLFSGVVNVMQISGEHFKASHTPTENVKLR